MSDTRKYTEAQRQSAKKWDAVNLDRLSLALPKGSRETIKAHAAALGESTNAFIKRAIDCQMERDGVGSPQGAAGQPIGNGCILSPLALQTAQETAQSTGETVSQFIERAVSIQAERDKSSLCLGLNPATGDKLEKEA